MKRQICAGSDVLFCATGHRPTGFRAPGYTVSDALLQVLQDSGVGYDSSVFPCPVYYAAKAAAVGAIRIRGRRSFSVLGTPAVLAAPTRPYRAGRPYWRRGEGMLELPIQVTRRLRLPFIGTTLTLAGPTRARWLTRGVVGEPFVNLELHGIDFLAEEDGLQALGRYQSDLRVPWARKLDTLSAVVGELRASGYSFVRLDQAAEHFAG